LKQLVLLKFYEAFLDFKLLNIFC